MINLLNYIVWDPDPILAHPGPLTIRYYSTCWLIGLLLGYLLMQRLYKQQKLGDDKFEPLFLYIFFGITVGARLGHCLFYQPEYFLTQWDHFIEMLIPMHHMPDGSWKLTGYGRTSQSWWCIRNVCCHPALLPQHEGKGLGCARQYGYCLRYCSYVYPSG